MTGFIEILCAVADFFSAAEGTFVSIAATVTAVAAVYGVRTWKRELEGKENFEAARNLLRATYKVRDAIAACRDIIGKEQREIKPVVVARQEFDHAATDAEVFWGDKVIAKARAIRSCVSSLHYAINFCAAEQESVTKYRERDSEFAERMDYIVMSGPRDTPDGMAENPFSKKVEKAVAEIEYLARPHLSTRINRRNRT
ncbi:MAG: hypothetical protein OD817_07305 [Gammaproteobacteria bacterium]